MSVGSAEEDTHVEQPNQKEKWEESLTLRAAAEGMGATAEEDFIYSFI